MLTQNVAHNIYSKNCYHEKWSEDLALVYFNNIQYNLMKPTEVLPSALYSIKSFLNIKEKH